MNPPPNDDFPDVTQTLDLWQPAAGAGVDLAAIYGRAEAIHLRSSRRWKRMAIGACALAASLLVAIVIPRMEVQLGGSELVIRWGPANPSAPSTDPQLLARLEQLESDAARTQKQLHATERTNDLLLASASDSDGRDRRHREEFERLLRHLEMFENTTLKQLQENERSNSALYYAVFDKKPNKGANP